MKKIYFKDAKTEGSLQEFMDDFCSNVRNPYFLSFQPTFSDPLYLVQECHPARRSFLDIVAVVNTYFPNKYSMSDVAKAIRNMPNMIYFYCGDIKKLVFMRDTSYNQSTADRDGIGCDGFSKTDFENLID